MSMNSTDSHQASSAQFSITRPRKCSVCGSSIGEHCFGKIQRKEGGPLALCCPACAIQCIETNRFLAGIYKSELRGCQKDVHFFSGEGTSWP
jgi:hypothetical protein